jgi:hypothetical protein
MEIPLPKIVFGPYASVKAGKEAELGSEEPVNREREIPQICFCPIAVLSLGDTLLAHRKVKPYRSAGQRNEISRPRLSPLVRN